MKRRNFLQSLAAATTLPALPLNALAHAAPVAATSNQPYLWASFVARVHNNCSPAKLQRLLKMDETTAKAVYSELIKTNVITPPNAYGFSQAINPYPQATMLNSVAKPAITAQEPTHIKQGFKEKAAKTRTDSQSVNQQVAPSQDDLPDQPENSADPNEPERQA